MQSLTVTIVEAGWGDSILVESSDGAGEQRFALVDCNDSKESPLSRCFVRRTLERRGITKPKYPLFDFVLATHAHADHIRGLRRILSEFGAARLYSSRFEAKNSPAIASLLLWAKSAKNRDGKRVCRSHKYVYQNDQLNQLGPVAVSALWPPKNGPFPKPNENDNSVVLQLKLGNVSFLLTGDCEVDNWNKANTQHVGLNPNGIRMIQAPHHGARNGLIDSNLSKPLLDEIASWNNSHPKKKISVAISCHKHPHDHPHPDVLSELGNLGVSTYRTDTNYHLSFATDGNDFDVQWSRV